MPKLVISFKNNEEELELYNEIIKHSDKSAYVKDVLRGLRARKNETPTTNINEKANDEEEELMKQLASIKFGG